MTSRLYEVPSRKNELTGDELAEQAWEVYVRAAEKAQRTHDLQDGISAGKAWKDFLDLFLVVKER